MDDPADSADRADALDESNMEFIRELGVEEITEWMKSRFS